MRLFGALFVLVTISLTVACTKRDAIEKARQLDKTNIDGMYEAADATTPVVPVAAVSNVAGSAQKPRTDLRTPEQLAAEKAKATAAQQKAASEAAYEQVNYSNFEVKNEKLIFHRISSETQEIENEVLGDIKPGKALEKELIAAEIPMEGDRPAKKYNHIFQRSAQIRILKANDGSLQITAKLGNTASTLTLKRVDEKAAGEKLNAVSKAIQSLTTKKKEILEKLNGQELQLKTILTVTVSAKGERTEALLKNEDIKTDEEKVGENTVVNFRKVKITDMQGRLLVNGKRTGAIGFYLPKAAKDGKQDLYAQMIVDEDKETKNLSRKGSAGLVDLSQEHLLILSRTTAGKDGMKIEETFTYQYGVQQGPIDQKEQAAPAVVVEQKTQPVPATEVVKPKEEVQPVVAPAPVVVEEEKK